MKHLYQYIVLLLALGLVLGLLAGCGTGDNPGAATTRPDVTGKTVSVVVTTFPIFDWARELIGTNSDHVALTLLQDKGTDFHNYQPTVEDIYKISTCDLFIYVGGESDKWVSDALAQAANKNMKVLCLLDALGSDVKEEKALEGMEEHEEEDGEEEGPEYDEHVWLSLRNASKLCAAIREALIAVDSQDDGVYRNNFQKYDEELTRLDAAYSDAVTAAQRKILLFADRYPFRYLADDYGLTCYAAFSGCSAESEASFETVNFLVGKVDELELPYVMKLEGSDGRMAETIIANSRAKDAQILELNSLQSVTARQVDEGTTYLGVMEANLEVLKTALGD